jgi:hypothetical protein
LNILNTRYARLLPLLLVATAALAQTKPEGPKTVLVEAGSYLMGSELGAAWEQPAHRVRLGTFHISAAPVTNAEYLVFEPKHEITSGADPDAPVTGVSFAEAQRYCTWLSEQTGLVYSLPTEARWEFAARGGLEQAIYAWGDEPPVPDQTTAPVDPAPRDNAFGMKILSGNLWEWTADWYSAEYYGASAESEPAGPAAGSYRVLRGGGFRDDPNSVKVFNRGSARPTTESMYITFRVTREAGDARVPEITEFRPPAGRQVDARGIYVQTADDPPKQATVNSTMLTIATPEPAGRVKISVPPKPKKVQPAPEPVVAAAPAAVGPLALTAIAVDSTAGATLLRIATSATPEYRTMVLSAPHRLVIDLSETKVEMGGASAKTVGALGVAKVRWAQFAIDPPVARVVVDLDRVPKFSIESSASGLTVNIK